MPRMSGRVLKQRVARLSSRTRVVFTSGYIDDAIVRNGMSQAEADFVGEPFTITALLRKMREVLDGGPGLADDLTSSRAC